MSSTADQAPTSVYDWVTRAHDLHQAGTRLLQLCDPDGAHPRDLPKVAHAHALFAGAQAAMALARGPV